MTVIHFENGRTALTFGKLKLNLHQVGHEFEPKADFPTPGSEDFCLLTETPLTTVINELKAQHVVIEEGPVIRHGATGLLRSVYVRDPDQNLVEISQKETADNQ
ncbi:VOC family protein [Secundilactobacillus folii]|uniref:VOC family protein n=1 Tax=Secundilactobacillus folii TaxID=2678357 RepID=UPI001FE81A67|nr:VOC family protein [Secundilactobacillus folii]